MPTRKREQLEEIRCRTGRPLELIVSGMLWRPADGIMPVFSAGQAKDMLQRIGKYSLYTLEEELKRGYITIRGGHRIGLAGRVITEGGHVLRIRDVASFNIRMSRQKIGVALPLVPFLYQKGRWLSTLLIGAPQTGKTTMLRDLARLISEGVPQKNIEARKIGVVDERSEIAGCVDGVPQNRLGVRTDVLDACPKAEGMMMLIRSMSPEVLIVDEIGRREDTDALLEALNAGVSIMATVHGRSPEQLEKRPSLQPVLRARLFERYLVLSRKKTEIPQCRLSVFDSHMQPIASMEGVWR